MVFIKEFLQSEKEVLIQVDGILDSDSIPILKTVCDLHLTGEKQINLDLRGLIHVSREGAVFLNSIPDKIQIVAIPKFAKLETEK